MTVLFLYCILISGNKLYLKRTIPDKSPGKFHFKLNILRLWLILSLFLHSRQTRSEVPSFFELVGTREQGGEHNHKIAASGS